MHNVWVLWLTYRLKSQRFPPWQQSNAGHIMSSEKQVRGINAMQGCVCVCFWLQHWRSILELRNSRAVFSVQIINIQVMSWKQSLLCPWISWSPTELVIYILQFWHLADAIMLSYLQRASSGFGVSVLLKDNLHRTTDCPVIKPNFLIQQWTFFLSGTTVYHTPIRHTTPTQTQIPLALALPEGSAP